MTRIAYVLAFLLVFPFLIPADEVTELPLGTSGARAFVVPATFSASPLVITDDLEYVDLSTRLEYYFDGDRIETPDTLSEKDFIATEGRVAWGFQDAACWFRFDYVAGVSAPKDLNLKVLVTGFPMTVRPGDKGTVYIYLDYPAGILSHARLYAADTFRQKANVRLALNALILGMNLALILYNIIIFVWTRDRTFLYFVLYLVTFTLHIYLREDYISSLLPFFRDYYFSMPPFVFAVLFTRSFLDTKKQTPCIHLVFNGFLVFGVIFSVLHVVGLRSAHIIQVSGSLYKAVIALVAVVLGVILSVRRSKLGFLYLVSWLPIIASNFILQFEQMGILQSNGPVFYFIVREGFYASGIFQAFLLSIALADKINIFRVREKNARREAEGLRELDQRKTNFIMNVSHELRTPLTLILGTTENVISGKYGRSISHANRAFGVLRRNASRLLFMINNLLNVTMLDIKKQQLRSEVVSPDRYLRFLVSEFESLAKMKDIRLVYEDRNCLRPLITADLELLEIIFLNLFSNAFKFVPSGGEISVTLETLEDACVIKVHNTGPGIQPEELNRVFERFYQADNRHYNKHEGIGVGLSLVKESVDELGGRITVRNHPESGVEFTLSLPLARGREEAEAGAFETPNLGILKASLRTGDKGPPDELKQDEQRTLPAILVVEDNEDLRSFLLSELQGSFTVQTAGNGLEALELIEGEFRPALIICDVMMPGMDGREFHREMIHKGFRDIPFLFLTARASVEEKLLALEEGVIDYLYKPFLPQELSAKVYSIITQNRESVSRFKNDLKERILKTFEADEYPPAEADRARGFQAFVEEYNLSSREKDVVFHLLKGLPDKEIAGALGIAVSTVSNTLHRVYRKTGIAGRMDLFRYLTGSPRR